MNLTVREALPAGFLECRARELADLLGGPTLIHLAGHEPRPVFVSILLHGNEATGLLAVQSLLRRRCGADLARSLSIFIGNVDAARVGQRYLPGQPDFNRIWCPGRGEEHRMTEAVIAEMRARRAVFCVDIHNNTGRNPLYSIAASREPRHLRLAGRFSNIVVYATYPDTTCTYAFAQWCPAVTLECGLSGSEVGVHRVTEYLDFCIATDPHWLDDAAVDTEIDLFHTVAVVRIPQHCSVGLVGDGMDVELEPGLDRYNFRELETGTRLAVSRGGADCIEVRGVDGQLATQDFFTFCGGEVRSRRPFMPAMLTTDREIIRMDCLCYLMERL